jgi:Putative Flp pilus-assembly TadE/G-like
MRVFLTLLNRFRTDTRGVFAVIFALMAIVLVAFAGAVVDFTTVQQARTRGQVALDAAALALQPKVNDASVTAEQIRVLAEGLFVQQIADAGIVATVTSALPEKAEGRLTLQALIKVPTPFVSLIGIKQLDARLQSQAQQKQTELEVVMVLDNSGSMADYSRIPALKSASKCATNILYYHAVDANCNKMGGATKDPKVKVGIVPFNGQVNIGASNKTKPWMDLSGNSSISNDNFDNDDNSTTVFNGAVNRFNLYTQTDTAWRGCVEVRPRVLSPSGTTYLDTDDTTPSGAIPNSLIVPEFAPDEPDDNGVHPNSYLEDEPSWCPVMPSCTQRIVKTNCRRYNDCTGTTTTTYITMPGGGTSNSSCIAARYSQYSDSGTNTYTGSGSNRTYTRNIRFLDMRVIQERLCKYNGADVWSNYDVYGPNSSCSELDIQPLTADPAPVLSTIDGMYANGDTNIQHAAVWGFRALSPTEPFTEGAAYSANVSKVMILMTDGENWVHSYGNMNGSAYYSAYGFPYNQRLGQVGWSTSDMQTVMNARTLDVCTNAKAAGITIYTIGLSTPAGSAAETMLKACASTTSKAYFPQQSSDLNTVFMQIANELMVLRITK